MIRGGLLGFLGSMSTPVTNIKNSMLNFASSAANGLTMKWTGRTIAVGTYRTLDQCQSTAISTATVVVLLLLAFAFGVLVTKLSSLRIT